MARNRPPDYLPSDVLARPDFRAACFDRDLGAIFAIAVQRAGLGSRAVTLPGAAKWVSVASSITSKAALKQRRWKSSSESVTGYISPVPCWV